MNKIVILDTETTDVAEGAQCIEVAAILFSVYHVAAIRSFSSLIGTAEDNKAVAINRIPQDLLPEAPSAAMVWPAVARMIAESDAVVAFGADFDRRFVPAEVVNGKPWICAMDDLAWSRATKARMSLVALALAYDLGVSHAHRAMVDCELLARLFARIHEHGVELGPFLARGLRPKARIVVAERGFDEARNALCKTAGFAWDSSKKEWWRSMPPEDAEALPFKTTIAA